MSEPTLIFDARLHDHRRQRALRQPVDGADALLRAVVEDLAERLAIVTRTFAHAVDFGTPWHGLAALLAANGTTNSVIRVDTIVATRPEVVANLETLPFAPESFDLAVSALSLHWCNDLPGVFAQVRRCLRPDGLFLAAFLGGETLTELRQSLAEAEAEYAGGASPRVAPFAEVRPIGTLLQRAGFALPVVDVDRRTIRYDSMFGLMRDLRAVGATNTLVDRNRLPTTRTLLRRAAEIYADRFSDEDGRIRATFDVIAVSAWAPHESQQKPLRPGTATTRLADALGVVEKPAGEKAGR